MDTKLERYFQSHKAIGSLRFSKTKTTFQQWQGLHRVQDESRVKLKKKYRNFENKVAEKSLLIGGWIN